MKKKHIILGFVAAALIASSTIAPALAYFTDHTEAVGSVQIALGDETHINERVADGQKIVSISSTYGQPVYIRVQAFAAEGMALVYSGSGWVDGGDGFWYFTTPIAQGETTGDLAVTIPKTLIDGDQDFNIVVVYESAPAEFNEDGDPTGYPEANWDTPVEPIE